MSNVIPCIKQVKNFVMSVPRFTAWNPAANKMKSLLLTDWIWGFENVFVAPYSAWNSVMIKTAGSSKSRIPTSTYRHNPEFRIFISPAMKTSNFETIEWLLNALLKPKKLLRASKATGTMLVIPALHRQSQRTLQNQPSSYITTSATVAVSSPTSPYNG